jgi:putative oxidoreductase
VGLLLLRLVAGSSAIARALTRLRVGPPIGAATLDGLAIAAEMLLVAGLWTPVSGSLLAALVGDILLAAIGAALALLGPGAWSVDARPFGWRRIDVRERS